MAVRITCALVVACAVSAYALDFFDTPEVRLVVRVLDECSRSNGGFSPCLKKKALTVLDRLSRMDKFSVIEGLEIVRVENVHIQDNTINEEQLDKNLPRSDNERDTALTNMLWDKALNFINSRSIRFTVPILDNDSGESRGKKDKMMGGLLMGIAGKIAAMIPAAIAGLFLLAGKALITAKIALLISGIIALKKLFSGKNSGGHGHSSGYSGGGGGGGGWQSSGGGGWDKRSLEAANKLAYKAYIPK